jgi:hypothetical protein
MGTPNIASPVRKAVASVSGYLGEVGQMTRLADPRDAWLPITESRSGNAYYAAFHSLSSGIGFQALVLPVAFSLLGWYALDVLRTTPSDLVVAASTWKLWNMHM